ncbi:MAG TPA: hypothetical protein GX003_04720 [Acholeplasmataceae bacterium]|jgi:hypothetical protein|nr:hypothetical protein [Acholeplasmataceae bacterium]
MQIKRQRIAFSVAIFAWLIFYGIQNIILNVIEKETKVESVLKLALPIFLILLLIGLFIGVRRFVRDDMITIKERDYQIQRVVGYIAAVPVLVLLFIDYIIRDNPNLNLIITIVSSGLLIVIGLFGSIYFLIISLQKPKVPFKKPNKVEEAEFKELD